MPLISSTSAKALSSNIATELRAGRKRAQAIAIAEAVRRRAKKRAT